MWPLCVISEKLFRVTGDDGPDSPSADGQIPLARRSYYVDVSFLLLLFLSRTHADRTVLVLSDKFRTGGVRFHTCSKPSTGTAASPACSWCSGRWEVITAAALRTSKSSAAPQGSVLFLNLDRIRVSSTISCAVLCPIIPFYLVLKTVHLKRITMLQNVVTWLIVKGHVVESNHIVRQKHYFLSFIMYTTSGDFKLVQPEGVEYYT
jgi:hypothetical protein